MERLCHHCGTIVSGEGVFCPQCGGNLDEVGGVNLQKPEAQSVTVGADNAAASANTTNTYVGTLPETTHTAPYVNPTNATVPINSYNEMTTGQWVGTILLTSCLGIISIVLLFVWAFSDTPQPKKNYCRGMLIVQAIMLGIAIIWMILMFVGMIGMGAGLAGILSNY